MKQLYAALLFLPRLFLIAGILTICIPASAQQFGPPVIWKKTMGGESDDNLTSIQKTTDGGVILAGHSVSYSGDVNPRYGNADFWVVKLDGSGQLVWKRTYGGLGDDLAPDIQNTPDGGYILTGVTYKHSLPDTVITDHKGGADAWVLKIDKDGAIQWKKCYGGSGYDAGAKIINSPGGGYMLLATTNSNDGDVTGKHGTAFEDVWLVKLSQTGAIEWQKCYGGSYSDHVTSSAGQGFASTNGGITASSDGGYVFAATVNSTDGDVTGFHLPPGGPGTWDDAWVVKVNSTGAIQWSRCYGGTTGEAAVDVVNTADNNYLLLARAGSVDGDLTGYTGGANSWVLKIAEGGNIVWQKTVGKGGSPAAIKATGDAIYLASETNDRTMPGFHFNSIIDAWFCKLDLSGNLLWQYCYGGLKQESFNNIEVLGNGQIICAGISNSSDGDVPPTKGGYDYWVVKLGPVNVIKGFAFIDNNLNGIRDNSDYVYSGALVKSTKTGKTYQSFSAINGHFSNSVDTGVYTSVLTPRKPYFTISPSAKTTNFTSAFNATDSFDFALTPVANKNDLEVSLVGLTPVRPGFNAEYRITYLNAGTTTLSNVIIKLVKSPKQTFVSATPAQQSINGDTITWNAGTLLPFNSQSISVKLKAVPYPLLNLNDTVKLTAIGEPVAGDELPADNYDTLIQRATAAWDPNDKTENNDGLFSPQQLASGKSLQYTIRFQNTGNDTAFNIVIRDTLGTKLDVSSIEPVAASHAYQLTIEDGNTLVWKFDNILLPDSNRNEVASHGYVVYRIRPKSTVAVGDTIRNSASIYFDFNPPVKTNTHETIIKALLATPSVSGVASGYCSVQGIQKGKLNNPPASGVTVKLDGNALAVAADSTFTFNVSALAGGAHVIDVTYTSGSETKTTSVNFNVTIAVSPDVNVGANNITAVNLIDPIIITATNAAGGGTSPLYTFAKDRNFSNILQAEGANNVLNVAAASLQTGDNWFYVRMKTSAACFTTQTNIDSIKISLQLPAPGQPALTGLKTEYCVNDGAQKIKLGNYPAAGTGTTVTVKLDGNAVTLNMTDTSFSFTPAVGNHVIDVTYANPAATKITTANFTVIAAATPDVNLSANGFTLTAVNVSGGGTTPLYTFAKDRSFTNILQAESANAAITLSNLNLGDNKIYVRMKTSLTCYTQQTAIDSITVTRFGASGLIDPDYPNQTISATPNPFRSRLVISGLSATKTYSIIIYNQRGAAIHRTKVAGSASATLYIPVHAAGAYMVSIYDETKKRMIGTLEVVKQ